MTEKELFSIAKKEDFDKIKDLIVLTDRQEKIFDLVYHKAMRQEDIAAEVECCRKTVSKEVQIIRKKIAKIQLEDVVH